MIVRIIHTEKNKTPRMYITNEFQKNTCAFVGLVAVVAEAAAVAFSFLLGVL